MSERSLSRLLAVFFGLSLFLSCTVYAQENYTWDTVRMGGGGFVSGIITSKSEQGLRYARTDVGGAYRWDSDAGEAGEWIPLNFGVSAEELGLLGIESLAIDESSPNKLYLLAGTSYFNNGRTAILRSDDYGATFEIVDVSAQFKVHGNGMGRQSGERLQVDPNNGDVLYSGSRWTGLFKSLDAGKTWARLDALDVTTTPNQNGVHLVVIDPSSAANGASQTLFVGVSRFGENLYRSDDAGASFSPIAGAPTDLMPHRAALASDGNLYLAYADGPGPHGHSNASLNQPMESGQVWKYDTATGAWTNVTPANMTRAFGGITVDPADPQRLLLSTINAWMAQGSGWGDQIFVSDDGGASWTNVISRGFEVDPDGVTWILGKSIHWAGSIEFDPFDSKRAWVVSGNGIFRADDIDATPTVWHFDVKGLEETVALDLVSVKDGPLISVIGDYDGFVHDDPSQYAPQHAPTMGTTTGLAVAALDSNFVARAGNALYLSTDGAATWTAAPTRKGTKGLLAYSADGSVLLHCPDGSSTTYRTTDAGQSWTEVTGLPVSNARPVADPVDANTFYVYGGSSLYRSDDGGVSFSAVGSLPNGGSKRLTVVPGKEGHLWAALNGQGLRRSTNGGSTFQTISGVTYCEAVGVGAAAPDASYLTIYIWGTVDGQRGLYRSTDQGASWTRVNDDDHEFGGPANGHFVVGDMNVYGRVFMSTAGLGIVYGEITDRDSVPWDEWLETHFTTDELLDETIVGATADPENDKISNLLEWTLGANPRQADQISKWISTDAETNALRFTLRRQAQLKSATLAIEVSQDLHTWQPIETAFDLSKTSPSEDNLYQVLKYDLKDSLSSRPQFLRLKTQPTP
ncbi:hypothetical protein [Pelagicoccus sp. SDUM812003]|uniref:hypothetical protein n=1 Tax=Pelagicoccus sp. SDUM812003 TaxID=3041267 RepID=UPI00281039C5|nr:hypothetical protein [Pelagicoccus sp. SDUM812003]MDQ8202187.1 hypothetical protein [Pelagicoccus sp. SDUM812003]